MAASVTTEPSSSKYLQYRPSPRTAPPADERMSKAKRWTVWTLRKNPDAPNKKPSKVPVANPTDRSTWGYFHACRALLSEEKAAGIGFEMYADSGITGIDIDNCLDESGNRSPFATQLIDALIAAGRKYHVEISPSGKGLRIFAGATPLPFHDFTNKDTGVEVYTGESGRFLAYTGALIPEFSDAGGPFEPLPPGVVEMLGKHAAKWKEGAARVEAVQVAEPAEPVPDLSRREDWEKLHPNAIKRLSKEHRNFLDTGALGSKYASASEQLFALEQALLKHLKPAQAFQILVSAEGSWGVALEHREGKEDKARSFIWDDLQRAAKSKETHEKDKISKEHGWKECDIIVTITDDGARARFLTINLINAFQKHNEWLNRLGYNTFDGRVTLDKQDITVRQIAEMAAWAVDFLKWEYEPKRDMLEEAITEAAKTRPWNPIADELRGLTWDGRDRIKKFAEALSNGEAPGGLDLDRAILRKWLVGYIARGLDPGCQLDTMLCLSEREGGGFKTTFCRVMAGSPERFSDAPGFGSDKDSSMLRVGTRVVELGEGVAVRKSDKQTLKLDLSRTDDHFRPPFGRVTERRKRGFVYVLTANEQAVFRSDQDGLRRVWPMWCKESIDIEWIRENREQLLAQAVVLFDKGEKWWWAKGEEPKELRERQFGSVSEDFGDGAVEAMIADRDNRERGYITLLEAKKTVEGISGIVLNATQAQHLIEVMLKHGLRSTQRRIDGRKLRVWTHPSWKEPAGIVLPFPKAPEAAPAEEMLE